LISLPAKIKAKKYTQAPYQMNMLDMLARPEKGGEFIGIRFNLTNIKIFRVDIVISTQLTSGNWENEKLCGRVFTQFRVFPISTSVDI
jgi:hypothetical protein